MFIMKVVHNNEIELVRDLQELRELLKKKNITIGLVESKEGSSHLVKIMCDEEGYSEKVKRMIYLYISNILYNIVIEKYRKKELFNFLTETYFFLKQEEILEVEEMIMKVRELDFAVEDLALYLNTHPEDRKALCLHNTYAKQLKDGYGNDIFNEFMKELAECKVDTEAKMEDIIISGLITNAPKQVIIHHKENCLNTEFIDTIVNVFGDRVFYCAGCANCESTKLKNIKLNN